MKVFIKMLKVVLGIILGLVFSFVSIVGLEVLLPKPNPFRRDGLNLWLTTPIIAGWLFLFLWLLLRKPSPKKIHMPSIEHLPVSVSEFINGVINAMKYNRTVRAEVQQELTDHFTDALAECETEEEKQEVTKELVQTFGDIELLGKLLRRAKKRCRPLWRTMVARTFQSIGICVLLLVLYIGWFFTGKPKISTDYLEILNQQVKPTADDSQNAWPFYKQAAEKYIKSEDEDFDFHPTNPSPFTRSEQDKQIIQQSIIENQDSLALIQQGNQKPYYWQVYDNGEIEDGEMMAVLLPNLQDYKNLTSLMCWQGLLNAEQGNIEKTFDDLLEVYSFGQHLRGQKTTLIEQLVAMSIEGISTNTLRIILAEYDEQIDATLLNSVREQYAAMIVDKNFIANYDFEKLFMYDEAQRFFTESWFGKSHLYLPRLRSNQNISGSSDDIINLIGARPINILFTHPDKKKTLQEVDRIYAEIEKIAVMTPASVKAQSLDMDGIFQESIEDNILLRLLLPALGKVNQMAWRSRSESQATLVILAITQYQKDHGQFPDSLDVLVNKGLLNEVPIDPYSDKALVYRQTEDGFSFYSVGYNSTDDGGVLGQYKGTNKNPSARRWTEEGDAVFWPVQSVSSQR
ncbi:MAG: hypothetical protein ACYSQY_02695 [Planctomycetota bacterium]|jgi:competence protein ComGC